jgi:hypothetical protein
MNSQAKDILISVVSCAVGALLAVISPSLGVTANAGSVSSGQASTSVKPIDRFTSDKNYCKVFLGAKESGPDGVTADFIAAVDDTIEANGDDVKGTFTMIRDKCAAPAHGPMVKKV